MKKLLGISLLVLLASINIYGEGIEKGQGKGISIGKTSIVKMLQILLLEKIQILKEMLLLQ